MEETERRENPNDTLQFPEVLFFLPDLLTPITCGSGLLLSPSLHFLNWLPKSAVFAFFCSTVYYVGVSIACTVYYRLRFEASIGFFNERRSDRPLRGRFLLQVPSLFCVEGGNKNGKVVSVRTYTKKAGEGAFERSMLMPRKSYLFCLNTPGFFTGASI